MYQRYANLRDSRGITDYRVAKETGIPASTFTEWKNGKYTPKVEKMSKLAKYFGVDLEYFIGGGNA